MAAQTKTPPLKPMRLKVAPSSHHEMMTRESYGVHFTRNDWAKTLVIAAALTLVGALGIDLLNSGWFPFLGNAAQPRSVPRALVFVGPIIALLAALYWLWPHPKKLKSSLKSLQKNSYPTPLRRAAHYAEKRWVPRVVRSHSQRKPTVHYRKTQTSKSSPATTQAQGVDQAMTPSGPLKLWSPESFPRLHVNLFESNVPTFVLSADQHFVDWNAGFNLAFAQPLSLIRGQHVSDWFDKLDNFRRLAKRREQLYGEAILPLADRERATFKHPKYGRMVYTKIMSPIIDLKTSKIIGWTIVLNINSVHHRKDFFDDLYRCIQEESRRIRYRAAYPDVFKHYAGRKKLLDSHIRKTKDVSFDSPARQTTQTSYRVLVWGPDSVALTGEYVRMGHHVTVLSDDVHLLRRVQVDYQTAASQVKLICRDEMQPSKNIDSLPANYFHKASVMLDTGTLDHYQEILSDVYKSLKAGGSLTLSAITDAAGLERIFQASFESLQKGGHMDQMKHQFHHVKEFEIARYQSPNHVILDRITLRSLAIEAGFVIIGESELHQDATTTLLVLQK
jgi:hypothetical protein